MTFNIKILEDLSMEKTEKPELKNSPFPRLGKKSWKKTSSVLETSQPAGTNSNVKN